jgi:hypothetical protein
MRTVFAATLIAVVVAGSAPAEAARLYHPSKVTKATERGVTVWRRAAEPAPAQTMERRVEMRRIAVRMTSCGCHWPERALRTQGFWSGDGLSLGGRCARRPISQGFYADRMAMGM